MAVANTKSTFITNADATPSVLTRPSIAGGKKQCIVGTVEVAAADDDGSVFRFARVPSNAVITSIKVFCDAITSGTSYDCGLYRTANDGGAVVDADAFASAVSLASAITTGTEIRFEAADINTIEKRVWEMAGATADTLYDYDICLTANTVGSAAGTISLAVEYVIA